VSRHLLPAEHLLDDPVVPRHFKVLIPVGSTPDADPESIDKLHRAVSSIRMLNRKPDILQDLVDSGSPDDFLHKDHSAPGGDFFIGELYFQIHSFWHPLRILKPPL